MIKTSYAHAITSSQTVGPFFHDCLLRSDAHIPVLTTPTTIGQRIRLEGRVFDGDGVGVPDAMLELWQANSYGRYNHPNDTRDLPLDPAFSGYGRTGTSSDGSYWFETIKPGVVPFDASRNQAPHLSLALFGRGLLNHLFTRVYFGDEEANANDPILQRVASSRQATLIATPQVQSDIIIYRFDIVLQGPNETVYFNFA
ncbi:MAG: protocatechuate 3,4-dioxygenase subunit alpha [Roseiflexaceae bacterium]